MSTRLVAILAVCMLTGPISLRAHEDGPGEDNTVLALVLARSYNDGGYTVVDPQATIPGRTVTSSTMKESTKSISVKTGAAGMHGIGRTLPPTA